MDSEALPDVMEAARSVLKGERHPKIYKQVMFFHTAGYRYPYDNMHYVVVAGGNSFYEKRRRMRGESNTPPVVLAAAGQSRAVSQDTPIKRVIRRMKRQEARSAIADAAPARVLPAAFAPSPERFGGPTPPTPTSVQPWQTDALWRPFGAAYGSFTISAPFFRRKSPHSGRTIVSGQGTDEAVC
jgi:hypothetical protein